MIEEEVVVVTGPDTLPVGAICWMIDRMYPQLELDLMGALTSVKKSVRVDIPGSVSGLRRDEEPHA